MARFPVRRAAAAIALAAAALGRPAAAMGLEEAWRSALDNDPVWRAALREAEAGQLNEALGRSALLPSVTLQYGDVRYDGTREAPGLLGNVVGSPLNYRSVTRVLSLRQPLFNWEALARWRQGQAQAAVAAATLAARADELVMRVAEALMNAQLARDQVALAVAERDGFAEQLQANRRLLANGEGTRTDVSETQARLDLAAARELETRLALDDAVRALEAITGPLPPGGAQRLREADGSALPPVPDELDPQAWRERALARNPALQAARFVVAAARQEVEKQRAGHLPRLDLVGSVSRNESETVNTINQRYDQRGIGVQMSLPLYAGGYASAAQSQAAANLGRAQAELDARVAQTLVDLQRELALVRSGAQRVQALRQAEESAALQVEATRRGVSAGLRVNVDVLNAQQRRFEVRRDLAQARYQQLMAYLRLHAAAGVLGVEELRAVDARLAPAAAKARPAPLAAAPARPAHSR